MGAVVTDLLVIFSAVFFISDPLGLVPVFLVMTQSDSEAKRKRMALKAAAISTAVLVIFAAGGHLIFKMFGITLAAFQIAGGLLLLLVAVDMLRAQHSRVKLSPEEEKEGVEKEDIAVVPLAIPMLAGPGALATVMVLAAQAKGTSGIVMLILVIVACGILSWLILRGASLIARLLMRTGVNIMSRIMGLILASIGMQFIINGLCRAFPFLGCANG